MDLGDLACESTDVEKERSIRTSASCMFTLDFFWLENDRGLEGLDPVKYDDLIVAPYHFHALIGD